MFWWWKERHHWFATTKRQAARTRGSGGASCGCCTFIKTQFSSNSTSGRPICCPDPVKACWAPRSQRDFPSYFISLMPSHTFLFGRVLDTIEQCVLGRQLWRRCPMRNAFCDWPTSLSGTVLHSLRRRHMSVLPVFETFDFVTHGARFSPLPPASNIFYAHPNGSFSPTFEDGPGGNLLCLEG